VPAQKARGPELKSGSNKNTTRMITEIKEDSNKHLNEFQED
jgi:hypothetical protein